MVAKTPPKQKKIMVAPLSPTLIKETVKKVDQCMARLQELQYTLTGGNKLVPGVKFGPQSKSTKGYLKTSIRCKQESMSIRGNATKKSPTEKLQASTTGEWRRMSLPAMLLGETVAEILQASQFTQEIMETSNTGDPKTPVTKTRKLRPINSQRTPLEARRKQEKQHKFRIIQAESKSPLFQRARSRINFKVSPPKGSQLERENSDSKRYLANRVSPRHKPWAKKTVLFPNPLFHSSPTSQKQKFCKTKSPIISRKRETPHKFLIKSPVKIKSPQKGFDLASSVPTKPIALNRRKSPPKLPSSISKFSRSFSPSSLANRFVSPLKARRNSLNISSGDGQMSGLKHKPPPLMMMPMRFSASRIVVGMQTSYDAMSLKEN